MEALLCFFFRVHINVNLIVSLPLKGLLVEKKAQKFTVEQFIVHRKQDFLQIPLLFQAQFSGIFLVEGTNEDYHYIRVLV